MERAKINKKKLWLVLSIAWVLGVALYKKDYIVNDYQHWERYKGIVGLDEALGYTDAHEGSWASCIRESGIPGDAPRRAAKYLDNPNDPELQSEFRHYPDRILPTQEVLPDVTSYNDCKFHVLPIVGLAGITLAHSWCYHAVYKPCRHTMPKEVVAKTYWQSNRKNLYRTLFLAFLGPFLMGVGPPLLIRCKRWITT